MKTTRSGGRSGKGKASKATGTDEAKSGVELLSGGNPRIAKADGDAPVTAWIEALPGWKREVGQWLDAVIVRSVPGLRKAVKWNSPLYGTQDVEQGFFLGVHAFDRYLKVTFFNGASLSPPPPEPSKVKNVRYLHLTEEDGRDEDKEHRIARWVRQAATLQGWKP